MSLIKLHQFHSILDDRGLISVFEIEKDLGFTVRRVYCLTGTVKGESRGYHAHRDLRQIVVCLSGNVTVHLDNGKIQEKICLDDPTVGLEINSMIWRELHDFSSGAVVMVLASEFYDPEDYIRDHDEFLKEVQN